SCRSAERIEEQRPTLLDMMFSEVANQLGFELRSVPIRLGCHSSRRKAQHGARYHHSDVTKDGLSIRRERRCDVIRQRIKVILFTVCQSNSARTEHDDITLAAKVQWLDT